MVEEGEEGDGRWGPDLRWPRPRARAHGAATYRLRIPSILIRTIRWMKKDSALNPHQKTNEQNENDKK